MNMLLYAYKSTAVLYWLKVLLKHKQIFSSDNNTKHCNFFKWYNVLFCTKLIYFRLCKFRSWNQPELS